MMTSRPVAARATRIASIVASVPEFTNRIWSHWNRSQIASASATVFSVVTAKWIASSAAFLMRLDDQWVGVADDVDAEPTVEVGVLGAVDVPDLRTLAVTQVHGVGVTRLEVRDHACRQRLGGSLVQLLGALGLAQPLLAFPLGDLRRARLQPVDVHAYHLLSPERVPVGALTRQCDVRVEGSSGDQGR